MLAIIFILLVTLIAFIYFYIRRQFTFFDRHPFLHDKPSFPFGSIAFKDHIVLEFKELYDKFKSKAKAFGVYYMLMPSVMITDLDVIQDILVKNGDNFTIRAYFYDKESDPLSAQLVSLDDSEWSLLRENFLPFFSNHKMKMIFKTLLNMSDRVMMELKSDKSSEIIEARQWFSKYASDVIGNIVFGIDMSALQNPNSKFCQFGSDLFKFDIFVYFKFMWMQLMKNLSKKWQITLYPIEVTNFFLGIVATTVKYRKANNIERNDILDVLLGITSKNEVKRKLSINDIGAQCFVFFLYGFETVSCTGAFVLYHLAMNCDIQEKLRDEIRLMLSKYENKITYEAIDEMKYLDMIINETIRLYPAIYNIYRLSLKDYKIPNSDLVIPKGLFISISNYSIHRDPEYYPEPEKFDPERFSAENKAKRHPMAFLPFGLGNNGCIGFRFGLVQVKLAIIQIMLNFQILSTDKTPSTIKFDSNKTSLSAESGLWMKLEKL